MKSFAKYIHILLFFTIPAFFAEAAELPALPKAEEITVGELPNGISYYIIHNGQRKGFADFALVQEGIPDEKVSRQALSELPHFYERVPYHFLAGCGIACNREGYISYSPESTRFDFREVPVYRQSVADSMLLMLFDIAGTSQYRQAIVVSGDISANEIIERMKVLSLVVDTRIPYPESEKYNWIPKDSASFSITRNNSAGTAAIRLGYSAGRISGENLNTIIPLVSKMYSYELGVILSRRLKYSFEKAGIPLADIAYRYYDSSEGPGDEKYTLTVYTQADSLLRAVSLIAGTLADIDTNGVDGEEFLYAKNRMLAHHKLAVEKKPGNAEYVDKCVSAWLYGSTLASSRMLDGLFSRKHLSEQTEVNLFNNYVSALLDRNRNLAIRCDVPEPLPEKKALKESFYKGWNPESRPVSGKHLVPEDSLKLYKASSKQKLHYESPDPLTGGKLWTFRNGMKVIFRKADTPGEFHYALLLRGGCTSVPGLKAGESAFIEDMLPLCRIAGIRGTDFFERLSASGIEMKGTVSLSDMRLRGKAPKNKLDMTLRALLSIAKERRTDRDAFERYRKEETLRLDMAALFPKDMNSLMDSMAAPENFLLCHKVPGGLVDELPKHGEYYFSRQFEKTGDGVLVLIGDLGEDDTKKELSRILGNFSTVRKYAPRPGSGARIKPGTITRISESGEGLKGGEEIGMNMEMSAPIDFTLKNYMSFRIAAEVFRNVLTETLADYGTYVKVSWDTDVLPSERFSLFVNCRPCFASGLPGNVQAQDPLIVLGAVRRATGKMSAVSIPETELRAYKAMLINEEEEFLKTSTGLISKVLMKYGEGKDTITGYRETVNSITEENVKAIISALCEGTIVEYVNQ